jgi:hypothetical protein
MLNGNLDSTLGIADILFSNLKGTCSLNKKKLVSAD